MASRPGQARRKPTPSRRPSVPTRRQPASQGRFSGVVPRRRPQKKASGMSAAFGALKGALPTGSSGAGSGSRGKKGAGVALATAAAGLAISNRDKLGSLLGRNKGGQEEQVTPATTSPTTPVETTSTDTLGGTTSTDTLGGTTSTGMPGETSTGMPGETSTGTSASLPEDDRPDGPSSPAI